MVGTLPKGPTKEGLLPDRFNLRILAVDLSHVLQLFDVPGKVSPCFLKVVSNCHNLPTMPWPQFPAYAIWCTENHGTHSYRSSQELKNWAGNDPPVLGSPGGPSGLGPSRYWTMPSCSYSSQTRAGADSQPGPSPHPHRARSAGMSAITRTGLLIAVRDIAAWASLALSCAR